MNETKKQLTLTYDEAVAFLPEGDDVHTFMDGGVALLGADWSREEVLSEMREAPEILITGPSAQAMKHGLAIQQPPNRTVFIETTRRTDEADSQ